MRREKFIYNTHTLRYEKVKESLGTRILRVFGFISAALVSAFIISLLTHRFFPSPSELALQQENEQLQQELKRSAQSLDKFGKALAYLQEKDAYAYRMIFGMEPIDKDIWEGGIGGHEDHGELQQYRSGGLMASVRQKVRKLTHQYALQTESLDEVMEQARKKEDMLASIPSIKPVRSDKLARKVRLLSGFGYRVHPIYKRMKFHAGIDFTAPKGTPIYATGAGRVVEVERKSTGYGLHVTIDHGYGYRTLYAHMSHIDVKVGEQVTRGQQIGLVGNSGTSTAPHCHYEVHLHGEKVNPIQYVLDGLSPEEYQKLVEASHAVNQSFD
jgi:murein DD-endopeptidase MepM/ murein hydrolase activator NlpD